MSQERELPTLELLQPRRFYRDDLGGSPLKLKGKHNRAEDREAGTERPEEEGQGLTSLG